MKSQKRVIMNSKILSFVTIVLLLLSGCGGGSSGNEDAVTSSKNIKGNWQRECTSVAILNNSNIKDVTISSSQITIIFTEYFTSDCSGEPEYIEVSTYDLSTTGSSSNSFCEFSNINTVLTSISVNGVLLTREEAATYTAEFEQTNYDIACNVDNQLYFGLEDDEHDSESEEGRPVEINTQVDSVLIPAFSTLIEGDWRKSCTYNEQFDFSYMTTVAITASQMNIVTTEYTTTDCSGQPDYVEDTKFDISIAGTYATSFCPADKIDTWIKSITVNGDLLTDEQAADYTRAFGRTKYDIICNVDNNLYFGLKDETFDAFSEGARPIQIYNEPYADILQ